MLTRSISVFSETLNVPILRFLLCSRCWAALPLRRPGQHFFLYYNRTLLKKQYCPGPFSAPRQKPAQHRSHAPDFYVFLTFTWILHSLDFGFYIAPVYSYSGETHRKHATRQIKSEEPLYDNFQCLFTAGRPGLVPVRYGHHGQGAGKAGRRPAAAPRARHSRRRGSRPPPAGWRG